jgi:hypothetical protein
MPSYFDFHVSILLSHYYKVCTIQIEGQSGPAAQSFRPPLQQRKSVGILEDLNPIGNFPLGLWNKRLNSYQSFEIPKDCLVS